MIETARTPPQSIESERTVLGALLLWPDAYDAIEWLPESDFYSSAHRAIYGAMVRLLDRGKGLDAILVCEALGDKLQDVGGATYIAHLATSVASAAGIKRHAEIIRSKARLRALSAHASAVLDESYEPNADPKEISDKAETGFLSVMDDHRPTEEVSFEQAIKRAIEARDAPQKVVTPTGYANLDSMLSGGGFKPGQLVVIAGRPSMGKSALAWNIAEHVAGKKHVAGFSLEMDAAELADRSLSYHASLIDRNAAALHCMDIRMSIDESPAVSLSHIRLKSRRLKRKYGLGLIVVDYLQLMESKADSREQEIAKISRGLKALAKELHVPVIAVAQLNRGVEQRQDKRPMLSDLRESGAVEQDADIVMMLYRDIYYNENSPAGDVAEVLIRKQRGGMTGKAFMRFTPETTRFHDYSGPAPSYSEAPTQTRTTGSVRSIDFKNRSAGD